jgi:hypothetical protein
MDTFISYSGWILAVAALAFGVWSFFRMKEEREPTIYYRTYIDTMKFTKENRLKVFFDSEEVNQVTTTILFFWNNGKRPIKKEDLPTQLMVVYPADDVRILDFKVLKVSRDLVNFSVTRCGDSIIELHFDFLDRDDGAVIAITHSGDEYVSPTIIGTVIGVPKGIPIHYLEKNPFYRISDLEYFKGIFSKNSLMERMKRSFGVDFIAYWFGSMLGLIIGIVASPALLKGFPIWLLQIIKFFGSQPVMALYSFILIVIIVSLCGRFMQFRMKQNFPFPKSLDVVVKK